jgi:peptide/nickel transport system ATP-binding protein
MGNAVVEVKNLSLHYFTSLGHVRAVDDVSFQLERGETLGIVGESGCGKTTMGVALLNMPTPPGRIVAGEIVIDGTDIVPMPDREIRKSIRWEKISMVFQGAMNCLTPVYTVGKQMRETLQRHKSMPKAEAMQVITRYLAMVGLAPDIVRRYPHELSGGMKQRVVIAMALFLEPQVVILDEPTTALDVIVQAQIINVIKDLKRKLDLSLIFITHDLATEAEVADRILVMYAGKVVEIASNEQVFGADGGRALGAAGSALAGSGAGAAGGGAHDAPVAGAALLPNHPYTRRLLAATPRLHEKVSELAFIPGTPPDLLDPPAGCRFNLRCDLAFDRCRREEPPLRDIGPGHCAACWRCFNA